MDRRILMVLLAGTLLLAQAAVGQPATTFYTLDVYGLEGTQYSRLNDHLRDTYVPALTKIHAGPVLVLEDTAEDVPPQIAVLVGYQSIEQMLKVRAAIEADQALAAATDAWQAGEEAPYQTLATNLLRATDFCPQLAPLDQPPETPRLFQLRVYHTWTRRGHEGLVGRFRDAEVEILARSGGDPILFSEPIAGTDMPNLTWMLAFDDMADFEAFGKAFSADPGWAELRQKSMEEYGRVPNARHVTLMRAAPYSPIR